MSVCEDLTVCDFLDIIDSWKLVGWGKIGFKAQTCWTDLLAFWGVWNRSRIRNFGPDRLFFRFSRALVDIPFIYSSTDIKGCSPLRRVSNSPDSLLHKIHQEHDTSWFQIRLFLELKSWYFFLFLHKNIYWDFSLEVPHQTASCEYQQHMFLWTNKKKKDTWIPLLSRALIRYKGYSTLMRVRYSPHTVSFIWNTTPWDYSS